MAFEDIDRRRTALLAVLTLIVLPIAFMLNRADTDEGADGAATTTVATSTTEVITQGSSARPPLEPPSDKPVFLEAPATNPEPRVLEIAVPPRPEFEPVETTASHRRSVAGPQTCLTNDVEPGLTVTVTNVNNRRSVECVTAGTTSTLTAGIVLHPDAFSTIADLTDAVVPVEITR